jgi:hypothetical protein
MTKENQITSNALDSGKDEKPNTPLTKGDEKMDDEAENVIEKDDK